MKIKELIKMEIQIFTLELQARRYEIHIGGGQNSMRA